MKKLLALFFLIAGVSFAQNLQLHYDFGKDREYFTTTFEMFRPDEYGSTFTFVDFDFNNTGNKSMSLAYWEIARYINVYKNVAVTAQYNDGIISRGNSFADASNALAVSLSPIWLFGVSYPVNLGFVTINTDVLYRNAYGSDSPDAQLTLVWFKSFLNGKLNFTGFMDVWSQGKEGEKDWVLLTEPQLWFNLTNHIAIGSELEISNNFVPGSNKVEFMPTVAAKWNF